MAAVNTHRRVGKTYYGPSGASMIDYLCVPQAAVPMVKWVAAWRDTAQKLRAMAGILDHVPVVMMIDMFPP
eukprot:9985976-Lingulodinium_polyedra.AAC.1